MSVLVFSDAQTAATAAAATAILATVPAENPWIPFRAFFAPSGIWIPSLSASCPTVSPRPTNAPLSSFMALERLISAVSASFSATVSFRTSSLSSP